MADRSRIEWTDATWNPVRGCDKISPGCKHCYAETFAERWRGVPGHPYEDGFDLRLVPKKLHEPLHWRKPRLVFVDSMADLFHKGVPDEFIAAVFGVMAAAGQHTFQVLTKRATRLPAFFKWAHKFTDSAWLRDPRRPSHPMPITVCMECLGRLGPIGLPFQENVSAQWPLPNVWLGVSVENRRHGLPRIDHLRATPAAIRYLSVEPLLEDVGVLDLRGIDWVIVGGESGPGARPMRPEWVRSIRDQCEAAGVAFFFKQWGGVHKAAHGRRLDGRVHNAMPMFAPVTNSRRAGVRGPARAPALRVLAGGP